MWHFALTGLRDKVIIIIDPLLGQKTTTIYSDTLNFAKRYNWKCLAKITLAQIFYLWYSKSTNVNYSWDWYLPSINDIQKTMEGEKWMLYKHCKKITIRNYTINVIRSLKN